MQVPNTTMYNADVPQYTGFIDTPVRSESVFPSANRPIERIELDIPKPEPGTPNNGGNPIRSADGDLLDFDWNRIRRFVQRFAWQDPPSDLLKDIRNFSEKRPPIFSIDGDRADFDFDRTQGNKKITYDFGDGSEAKTVEPKGECHTCDSRRYVDKSDDSSVSYQTPTKLNPQTAALSVGAHEREHVFNERAKADREGRTIVSQTVSIKYSVCPECNIMYPSGGTTRTQSVKSGCEDQSSGGDAGSDADS